MRIQHNIKSLNIYRNYNVTNESKKQTLEKLSSGYKINRAGDDAAGLAISEKMRGQIRGLDMASKNAQDGIALIQTAEGALHEIHAMLQRVRELAVQAASDTNEESDKAKLQDEVNQLFEEIDAITDRTEYNGMKLLRGGGSIDPGSGGGGGGGGTQGTALAGDDLIQAQTAFTERLVTSTLENSEQMLRDYFGLSVSGKTMDVSYITDGPGGMVARVWMSTNPRMEMDNADFFTTGSLWIDEDRIIAHEMVHAVMAGSGINMSGMPHWFIEGSAEFLPGAIERLKGSVNSIGAKNVVNMLTSSSGGSHFYSAGYAATIFMDAKIRQVALNPADRSDGLKSVLSKMQGTNLTLDVAFKQVMGNNYGLSEMQSEFKTKGTDFITHVVTNATGVGSIVEISGIDSNGMPQFTNNQTNTSIVPDSINNINTTPEATGFTYVLNDNTHFDPADVTPSIGFRPTISNDGTMKLHIGANSNQTITVIMPTVTVGALGLNDVDIQVLADYSIPFLDNAINAVSTIRSKFGAIQNRLEHTVQNLSNASENLTVAESRIRDTDMAKEMMNFTKKNILMQAAQSMLSQSNQQPYGVLQLLN